MKYSAHFFRLNCFNLALVLLLFIPAFSPAQQLTGKWVVRGPRLDNGDINRTVYDLHQNGNNLSGSVKRFGYIRQLTGTVNGTHFALYIGKETAKNPWATGEISGRDLHVKEGHRSWTAIPAEPEDDMPTISYIEPPALHSVPYNGLAKTPPMGWNSWNLFEGKIDDRTVREIADAMVTSGMRDAGYIYVNIDDTWEGTRDAHGVLQPNPKFPNMKALADYVHSKGLKLGIYSSPGPRTCAEYPGSYGYEEIDAKTYAAWGIDYLKYDWCTAGMIYSDSKLQPIYQKMGDALRATGRPIVYSLCEYGKGSVEHWGPQVGGNLWRTTYDIRDEWKSMIDNIEKQVPTAPYAGPGHWNDPDMLEIGNGHMTTDEYRTHMSLWALTAAPLLAGNDIRNMSEETKSILLNKEVIAIDQDALGNQASPVRHGELETWIKPLSDGSVAVGIVNLGASAATASVTAQELGFKTIASARDLWKHQDVVFKQGSYSSTVPSHGTLMLRVSGK